MLPTSNSVELHELTTLRTVGVPRSGCGTVAIQVLSDKTARFGQSRHRLRIIWQSPLFQIFEGLRELTHA
ncbi:hypothetical protein BRADI_3g49283v3 [Brachypodium distachyon]|uniref:Uncharacterized protein n=1 Tax=Brachypodium distachyon TaxID=15368 RepID=A0A2K2D4A9_BRADI|nr:hypothetical protein BRADI_3g49283v3 [Brachypodium distachyon]